jgi:very-short-patch-repair endonuclease
MTVQFYAFSLDRRNHNTRIQLIRKERVYLEDHRWCDIKIKRLKLLTARVLYKIGKYLVGFCYHNNNMTDFFK